MGELAPYAVVRVAGLPFSTVEDVRCRRAVAIARKLDGLDAVLAEARDALCERLFRAAHGCRDARSRRAIVALKRAVFNDRPLPADGADMLADASALRAALRSWDVAVQRRRALNEAGEQALERDLEDARERLARLWSSPVLQNGVLFAQPHLFDRLTAAYERSAVLPDKLLGALVAYCYRAATKTSPFSTFTTTTVRRLEPNAAREAAAGSGAAPSTFTVNAAVVDALDEALQSHGEIGAELPLYVNDTAEIIGDAVGFLASRRTTGAPVGVVRTAESLMWVERNEFVDLLLRLVWGQPGTLTRSALIERVAAGASPEIRKRVSASIERLVRAGLLWRSLEYDANSLSALAELAGSPPLHSTRAGQVAQSCLRRAQVSLEALADAAPAGRRRLIAALHDEVAAAFVAAGGAPPGLRQQGLVHHDAYRALDERGVDDAELARAVAPALARIQAVLPLFNVDLPLRRLVQGRAARWIADKGEAEGVVSLYRRFCADGGWTEAPAPPELIRHRAAVALRLRALATSGDGAVEVPAGDLAAFADLAAPFGVNAVRPSVGYLGQLWHEDGRSRFAVNRVVPGYGALAAHAAAGSDGLWLTESLAAARAALSADAEPVDLVGTFGFDGQIGARLSDRRLAYPGEKLRHDADGLLPWSEVTAAYDAAHDDVRLWHAPTQRWLVPMTAGALAPGLLPPFFRFVMSFGPALLPDLSLVDLFEQDAPPEPSGVRHYARLSHAGVVLLRRTWCVPGESLPLRAEHRRASFADFRRLRAWARELDLPQRVFVTLARPGQFAAGDIDAGHFRRLHKPVYVDWDDVLSQQNLRRFARAVTPTVTITEMLPVPSRTKGRVTEHLLELTDAG